MTNDTTNEADEESTEGSLTIRRTFDAPRERVWRAFTDPDEFGQWFAPGSLTPEVNALEPEPGGEFSVSFVGDEDRTDIGGSYLEVVEDERLVSGEETEDGELTLTYEFRDVEGGTEVVLTQEFPDSVPDGAAEGWAGMLDNLPEVLA